MDINNFINDSFELIESEGRILGSDNTNEFNFDDEFNDILLNRLSEPQQIHSSPLRPIDLPSHRKHYGLLTFYQYRIPIVFRLVLKQII